ncbi:hypothetical protein HA402_008971 [Bradysia odoriphaga]|nr:hypothetical protein HA402_008971 [Bradysia odoriphaga]
MPEMKSKHANTKLPTILKLIFFALAIHIGIDACKISEFACRGGSICLPLDKYCDGRDDCGDSSDEPKFCTVCNRTYYGDIGRTYSLRVPPPQWNRLPFLCHITFTASGHEQGDIVQIIFDAFSVGRFDEGLIDADSDSGDTTLTSLGDLPGCPEGFMQLSELGRPFTGGSWCGAATGPQLYYSETSTVTASVKVFHAPMQAATPFEFKIRYKFISQSDAVVRYGAPNELLELGKVTPGTYCTRQFDECYRKKCRLQSPNYPGMYPRNVTCYWTIRQKTVPTCKHAMVSVSQENAHKALVKRSIASLNKTFRSIRAWSDCTGERDHLIFYDGSSTNDPVLAKYCGGDWLPKVGPEMLVAFHSSPFSAPLQSNIPNRGFELDVDMFFVDSDSHDYAQGTRGVCEFNINASNPGKMGKILSPRHTLPPNTTCTYYFHGQPGDLIWISFTSYNLQILQHAIQDNNTLGRVSFQLIFCIGTSKASKHLSSRKLIAEHYDNETPRLCDHSLLENSANRMRPCSPLESYVSSSKDMKIEFHSHTGTALYPASFSLNYEFVDTDLGGENWLGRQGEDPVPALCSRIFRKRQGNFQSPRNVFLHGRGGAKNISCLYRFEAEIGERVRLVVHNVSFGDAATCNTETDLHTGRAKCTPSDVETDNVRQGELKILDVPYRDVKITLGCFCDNTSSLYNTPLRFQSYSRTMELMFTVTNLNISEDFADIYFHASYEYVRVPDCPKRMRLGGSGGEEDVTFPLRSKDASCEGLPWFIEAQEKDRSLFVMTWGTFLPMEPTVEDSLRCITRNRLLVYSGKPLKIVRIICPGQPEPRQSALHIFSEDWLNQQHTLFAPRPVHLVIEPIFRDPGSMGFQWMEIQRTRASQIQQLEMHTNFSANDTLSEFGFIPRDTECEYKCPELDACIAASLWCDGRSNCPSGYDESEEECGTARKLLELPGGLFAAMGCIAAALAACLIFCIIGLVRKKRKSHWIESAGQRFMQWYTQKGSAIHRSGLLTRTTLGRIHSRRPRDYGVIEFCGAIRIVLCRYCYVVYYVTKTL